MKNNDIFRRLRYALNYSDGRMVNIFSKVNKNFTKEDVINFLKHEEDENFKKLSNEDLIAFLDGLVIFLRGKKDEKVENQKKIEVTKNNLNNQILRRIKIALSLTSEEMLEIFQLAGQKMSKNELSAIFRREEHKNYREAGDKYVRMFLKGLVIKNRKLDIE